MPMYRLIVHGTAPWGTWSHAHWAYSSLAQADVTELTWQAIRSAWIGDSLPARNLAPRYHSSTALYDVEVYTVDSTGEKATPSTRLAILDVAGTSTTACLPPANSMVMSWRSSQPGRHGRGRTYLPPMIVSMVTSDGGVSLTDVGNVCIAMARFARQLRTGGAPIGVPTATYSGVFGWQAVAGDVRWDTQRQRRRDERVDYTTEPI